MSHSSPALVVGRHASTRRRDRSVWSTTAPVSPVAVTAGTTPATRVPRSNATPHAAPVRPGLTPETERGGPSTATARVVRVDDGRRRPVEDNVIQRGAARCRLRRFAALLPGSDVRRRPSATLNVTARKVPVILGGRSLATGPIARHRDDTGDALPRLPPLPAPPRRNPVDNAPPTTYRRSRRRDAATRKKTTVRWLLLQSPRRTIRTAPVRSVAGNTRTEQSLAVLRRSRRRQQVEVEPRQSEYV